MNIHKIEQILQGGEHERVAFHAANNEVELGDVVVSVAAMANGTGGTIFLGVDKAGTNIKLFEKKKQKSFLKDLMRKINESLMPPLTPSTNFLKTSQGVILVLHVLPAATRPILLNGVAYQRHGDKNVMMTRLDLDRTIHAIPQTFDRRPVSTATLNELDEERLRNYLRLRQQAYPQSIPLIGTIEELWHEVQAVTRTEQGLVPNISGILFFARNPARWLPHARIKLARFQGSAPIAFIDRDDQTATLPELINRAESFIRRNTKMASRVVGFESVQVAEYPYPALREALVNAFVHRDWEHRREAVQVNIFDDRIEVHSPGEPLLPIDQLEGVHASRNDNLCYLFKDIGEMEQFGTGVAKMRRLMKEHGLQPPRFETQGPIFKVTFYGPGERILDLVNDPTERLDLRTLGLNARQIEAMRLLRNEAQTISNAEYRKLFGVSDRTALRDLSALMKLGLVRRVGSGPQSFYLATDNQRK